MTFVADAQHAQRRNRRQALCLFTELPRRFILRTSPKRSSKKFAPTLDCWHHMYRWKAPAHSLYKREEGENTMQVEGITWHALTLKADHFGATKKLLIEVFGLRPAIDTTAIRGSRCPTAPSLSSTHQKPSLPTVSTKVASCSASGWRTSKRPQRNWLRPDASFWARSLASSR